MFANVIDSLSRVSVPLFVMLSGSFLLDPKKPFNLWKRLKLVIIPLIVVSFSYILLYVAQNNTLQAWETIRDLWYKPVSYHLWFSYMLIGLYLLTPIFRVVVNDTKITRYFLILWLIYSVLVQFGSRIFGYWLGDWSLNIHGGYVGYFVLGYVLKNTIFNRSSRFFFWAWVLGFILTLFCMWGSTYLLGEYNEIFYAFLAPNVVLMSSAMFLFFKTKLQNIPSNTTIFTLGTLTYGVYLYHILFISLFDGYIASNYFQSLDLSLLMVTRITFTTILTFFSCYIISKIKYVRYYVLGIQG